MKMPSLHLSKNLICVDDSHSSDYNKIISMQKEKPKSFEFMKRDDLQYEFGVVVEHNKDALSQRGSCIFLHVQKEKDSGTAGCTSMQRDALKKIVLWLDKKKNPLLIQIKKSSSKEIREKYPSLKSSKLLRTFAL
jgi:L,D-peptidoglycan transpeptidase YkuD (ErfK/YbiS/YcfS/YnhG family)